MNCLEAIHAYFLECGDGTPYHSIMAEKSSSKTGTIIFMFVLVVGMLWFLMPVFSPVYMWLNVDFEKIAQRYETEEGMYSKEALETEYRIKVVYKPRGKDDPAPYQIYEMQPEWDYEDEWETKVRVILINSGTGEKPGRLITGNATKDIYKFIKGHRLPPGSLDLPDVKRAPTRPIILYTSYNNAGFSKASAEDDMIRNWESDDEWYDRDDEYVPMVENKVKYDEFGDVIEEGSEENQE